jgi:hypothetical protein
VIWLISSDKDNHPDALNGLTPEAFGLGMDNHCQHSPKGNKSMSDKAEGAAANAGATVQKKLNQAGEAQDQLVQFIRDNPMSAALVFVGIGYVLGKII